MSTRRRPWLRALQETIVGDSDWLTQTLYGTIAGDEPAIAEAAPLTAAQRAQRYWCGAIAATERLLARTLPAGEGEAGLVLSAPVPVLSQPEILARLHVGTFAPQPLADRVRRRPFELPAAGASRCSAPAAIAEYPLFPIDPLASEQFCLVLTAPFALLLVVGEDDRGESQFRFEFAPEAIERAWQILRARLLLASPHHLPALEARWRQFAPVAPDYRLVSAFSRALLDCLPEASEPRAESGLRPSRAARGAGAIPAGTPRDRPFSAELELLQALAHEIRTPLTTIRMLARRLLKKRRTLTPETVEPLESIDQECTEQINRMELIFRAVELETRSPAATERVPLAPIALRQLIQQSIPHWQKQAQRRKVNLEVLLPEQLPAVVSNPLMLDKVLMGLMESLTRSLPLGSQLQMQVTTAGHQLKLQLRSAEAAFTSSQSLGQLLMFQPETGNLSLNLDATKNLFQAMGGKLTVRQHPQRGEVLTIFLPLGNKWSASGAAARGEKA